jgi:hypothetical protein
MRRNILLGLLCGAALLMGGLPAAAQGSKAEVFLGGSFARVEGSSFGGWNTSVTGNMLPWLGVTADFSGQYNSPVNFLTYTFGPRLAVPQDSGLVPFTQATFGAARLKVGGASDTGFGAYIGGGLDWVARDYLAVRLMQIDAQLMRIAGTSYTGTRISFGVVFRLGRY